MQYAILFNELPPYPGAYAPLGGGKGSGDTAVDRNEGCSFKEIV